MPLTFPSSPTTNQTYTVGARTWTYSGTIWELSATAVGFSSVGENELTPDAVTTAKIANSAITTAKISNSSVTVAKIESNPTFTGTVTLPSTTSIGNVSSTEIGYVDGVTSAIQTQIDTKSPLNSPTFTGTVVLPATTSIGTVSNTEISYVDGVTSAIQTQLDSKLTASTAVTSGRNMVVNGDFKIWQRGTSFSSPANATFTADRWFMYYDGSGATRTISQQTFTGDNPTGLNVSNYMRVAITVAGTGSTTNSMFSKIEDVRKLNSQTVTLSFYGKADASRTVNWQTYQEFGTGGSGSVQANSTNFSFTSSWQRFSVSFTMPSVSGKTITSNSSVSFIVSFPANATGTFDITGIQLEAGSVATPFEFEDYQVTLAKCQRYYCRLIGGYFGTGFAYSTSGNIINVKLPTTMRIAPTAVETNGTASTYSQVLNNTGTQVCNTIPAYGGVTSADSVAITSTSASTGMVTGNATFILSNNGSSYLGFSAEL